MRQAVHVPVVTEQVSQFGVAAEHNLQSKEPAVSWYLPAWQSLHVEDPSDGAYLATTAGQGEGERGGGGGVGVRVWVEAGPAACGSSCLPGKLPPRPGAPPHTTMPSGAHWVARCVGVLPR